MAAKILNFEPLNHTVPPHLQAPVLLTPGEYELAYLMHQTNSQFGRGVLTLWFRVLDYDDVTLPRYYNVRLTGKKSFVPARHSALVTEFRQLFVERIGRLDRFPLHWLDTKHLLGEIGTVTKGGDQELLPDSTQYSVIRSLTKCISL